MTIEPSRPDGKVPEESGKSFYLNTPSRGVLSERGMGMLALSLVIGIASGVLGYMAGGNPAAAVLTGGAAFGGAVALLLRLLG